MLDVDGFEDYQSWYDEADDEQAIGDKVGRVTSAWKKREELRETQQQQRSSRLPKVCFLPSSRLCSHLANTSSRQTSQDRPEAVASI